MVSKAAWYKFQFGSNFFAYYGTAGASVPKTNELFVLRHGTTDIGRIVGLTDTNVVLKDIGSSVSFGCKPEDGT